MIRKSSLWLLTVVMAFGLVGCASTDYRNTARKMHKVRLGMTPDEVLAELGNPTSVRAAKMFEGEEFTTIWEYLPPIFTLYPKTVYVFFENGRVVQWGEPGDLSGEQGSLKTYSEAKGK